MNPWKWGCEVTDSGHCLPARDREVALVADGLLSVAEAVRVSALSRSELYARMGDGSVRYVQYGRRRLVARRSLLAFLAARLAGTA